MSRSTKVEEAYKEITAIARAAMAQAELCQERAKYLNLKEYTNTLQADCKALMEENAALEKENKELRLLLNMRK
jgi:regulator of replication initiation timing